MFIKIEGFAPDLDVATPGILVDCDMLIPTKRGMKAMPAAVSAGLAALPSACLGAYSAFILSGAIRTFAGTATGLYEASSATWTDVTRVSGGAYSASIDSRWSFAQFGNVTLATNVSDTIQYSNTSGAFANVAGAPKAKIIETVGDFVMAFGTNEATYGDSPDRWWCAGIGTYTDWTPAIATQSATGRLTASPGTIRAARRLGSNQIVAYKERSMYVGTYTGGDFIWSWQLVPGQVGTFCQDSVILVDTMQYFIGYEDFYYFDGTVPRPIENPVREWFFDNLNSTYRHLIVGHFDRIDATITWHFPSTTGGGAVDTFISFNLKSGKWGKGSLTVQYAFERFQGGYTYDSLGTYFATYDDFPNVSYDSPFWLSYSPQHGIFNASHTLQTLTNPSASCSYTTGDGGIDGQMSLLSRVRPRFITVPTTATQINYYRNQLGAAKTTGATTTISSGKFDALRAARWHSVKHSFTGDMEVIGLDVDIELDSDE